MQAELGSGSSQVARPRNGLKTLLLVGLKREPVESLVPALRRRAVEVASTTSGPIALASCQQRRYDLVVLREPVADLEVEDFLAEIRHPGSPCEHAFVQIVTGPGRVEELGHLAGRRLAVCSITDFGGLIATISRVILGIAPRVELRLMVELMMHLKGGKLARFCQVANVSETGVLVRTSDLIPVGESVEVMISLPGGAQPVRMDATVVRHTGPGEIAGFALKVTRFQGIARTLWRDFLRGQLALDDTHPLRARAGR